MGTPPLTAVESFGLTSRDAPRCTDRTYVQVVCRACVALSRPCAPEGRGARQTTLPIGVRGLLTASSGCLTLVNQGHGEVESIARICDMLITLGDQHVCHPRWRPVP